MTELVKIRGLNRRGIRVGSGTVTSSATKVVDLDSGSARRDLAKHSAIGQFIVVGDTPAAVQSGAVVSNGTTTTWSVSAGVLLNEDGSTKTIAAASNQAITAPDATNPRIDLVVVDISSGAVTKQDGTAAAAPVRPTAAAGKLALATLTVAANATTPAGVVVADVAPRLL